MAVVMDLIAGDAREILLAIGVDDWNGLRDTSRFAAYLPLGGRMDPSWLDFLSRAACDVTGSDVPGSFSEACWPLEDRQLRRLLESVERTIERVDAHWVEDMAMVPDRAIAAIASCWIELIEFEGGGVDPDDKPMMRAATAALVDFCRRARAAEDVLLAWTI